MKKLISIIADVNGDGLVNVDDALDIQKFLSDQINAFSNGHFVLLG